MRGILPGGSTDGAVAEAFVTETRAAIDQEYRRIAHSLGQLSRDQVWTPPAPHVNSVGTIVLHLCGNLRQWFLHGLGGDKDVRNRAEEFAQAEPVPNEELLARLATLVRRIHEILDHLDPESLLAVRRIQGFETNGLAAIYSTVTHLEGHSLQIAYVTHLLLGPAYEPFWKPASTEQGNV